MIVVNAVKKQIVCHKIKLQFLSIAAACADRVVILVKRVMTILMKMMEDQMRMSKVNTLGYVVKHFMINSDILIISQ